MNKQESVLPSYETVAGKTIKQVRLGYETYGRLNANKSNVILITHFFSGTSHAAGKYSAADALPGYWDAVIGPGKAFDTDRYFVISIDNLVNVNANDPHVITTGPASIDPDTGKPYAMGFPAVGLRDFVRTQKALLASLGIQHLEAVAGASSGAALAMQWATDYPDFVDRAIPVTPPGLRMPAYTIEMLELWSMPIRLDPAWNRGDYYGTEGPKRGLAEALKFVNFSAVSFEWAQSTFGSDPHAVQAGFDNLGAARSVYADANSLLYTARAIQTFNVEKDADRLRAKVLFIPARSDLIFPPTLTDTAAAKLRALGKDVETFEIQGTGGHLDGLTRIGQASGKISDFLKQAAR